MLSDIATIFQPYVDAAGLSQSDHANLTDMSWIEYRASDASRPYVLGIYHNFARRTITAEAWRPGQLYQAITDGMADRVADEWRKWNYEDGADLSDLRREIATVVLAWVVARSQHSSETM